MESATRTVASPPGTSAEEFTHRLFILLTDIDPYLLDDVLIHEGQLPEGVSAKHIRDRLADFAEVNRAQAARLLDVSASRLSRNDNVDARMLDRIFDFARTYGRVASVIGDRHAKRWLTMPNPALDDARPMDLLHTRYGARQVENLIESLLNGAVV